MSKEQDKKPTSKSNKKLLIIIAAIILIMLCFCCTVFVAIGSDADKIDSDLDKKSEELEDKVNDNISGDEDKEEETKPKTQTVEEWQDVKTFSGSANKKTEPFTITGKRWKVVYTIKNPSEYSILYINAIKPGEAFGDTVVYAASKSGETLMYSKGELYLDISAANCSWTVTIEQLVDVEKPI